MESSLLLADLCLPHCLHSHSRRPSLPPNCSSSTSWLEFSRRCREGARDVISDRAAKVTIRDLRVQTQISSWHFFSPSCARCATCFCCTVWLLMQIGFLCRKLNFFFFSCTSSLFLQTRRQPSFHGKLFLSSSSSRNDRPPVFIHLLLHYFLRQSQLRGIIWPSKINRSAFGSVSQWNDDQFCSNF